MCIEIGVIENIFSRVLQPKILCLCIKGIIPTVFPVSHLTLVGLCYLYYLHKLLGMGS